VTSAGGAVTESRVGPLSMLAACLLPVAGAVAIDAPRVGLVGVVAELTTLSWLVSDPRRTALRLVVGLLAAVAIAASTWLYGGHRLDTTTAAAVRIMYIVLPAAVLTPAIRPSSLGDHLAQRLHLPARPVVGAVASLQRLEALGQQWIQVQRARRARGMGVDGWPIRRMRQAADAAFTLLVVAMRQTSTMAMAMDARGFGDAVARTWAEPAPWLAGDSVLLGLSALLAVLPWLLR
jgi:energy-coupling factor transporter transmembrane protein EcfT